MAAPAGVDAAEDGDCTGALLGEEDVPVGGSEEITGVAQAGGVEGDLKAGRNDGQLAVLTGDYG